MSVKKMDEELYEMTEQTAFETYSKLPLSFVANQGQRDSNIQYYASSHQLTCRFTSEEVFFTFLDKSSSNQWQNSKESMISSKEEKPVEGITLALRFLNFNPAARLEAQNEEIGKFHYFRGNDPAKWHTNVPTYRELVYRNVWSGIDVVFRGVNGQIKYDFVLKPGAKLENIQFTYDGADTLYLDEEGNIRIVTPLGMLTDEKPFSYQEVDGTRKEIESYFVRKNLSSNTFGFQIGEYDTSLPLIIDPGLTYSTYLGGTGDDGGVGIAVDSSGNAYVSGFTSSADFPTTVGAFQTTYGGRTSDAFVTKFNAAGSALVYSAFLGGSSKDESRRLAVDASGNAYVAGVTESADFPVVNAVQPVYGGGTTDSFITKINPAGSSLVYSTFLGGSGDDNAITIKVDGSGNAYTVGFTSSTDFPVTAGAFQTTYAGGANDAFITKLDPAGSSMVYSTFLGGSGDDQGNSIAVDGSGNVYVVGQTDSAADFPTTAGAFQTVYGGGAYDAFATKLNSAGSALIYSTYLGGSGDDRSYGIALDASNHAYVVGTTASAANFPVTSTGYQTTFGGGGSDAFLTRMNAAGSALIYSSYLGGNDSDEGYGITLDVQGMTYVSGITRSVNFPVTPGAFQAALSGPQDVFVAAINTNTAGSLSLVNSTYLGGSGDEVSFSIAVDNSFNLYVPGFTSSANFPTTAGAFQTTISGTQDAFITKLQPLNILQRIIKSFIASRRFNSTIGAGTGTGAAFSIAATTFTNDAGAVAAAFPGSFPYYNLYINTMIQEGNTSTVTTSQINIPNGDVLDPATPIVVEFVVN